MNNDGTANKVADYDRNGVAFINLGSLLAQIVQISGYPTLLALALSRVDYPSWVIGIIVSLQWLVVLILAPVVPALLARFGPRATGQAGAAISMLALSLLLVSTAMPAIAVSSFLMGVGLTVRWVACDTWIVESVPERLRGRVVGIHETLMGLGIAIGPVLTMLSNGSERVALLGFMLLLVFGALSFSLGARAQHAELDVEGQDASGQKLFVVFRMLILALLAALVGGYIETAMVALLPIYLMKFDYSEAKALVFLSVFGAGGTLLQIPLGWIADRWSFRAAQILCATLIVIGGLALVLAIHLPPIILVALFVWGGCVGGLNTLAVIEAGATLKAGLSGTGMALIASSYTLGGVIGPIISGAALGFAHGHGAIVIILAFMVVYALILTTHRYAR